MKIPKEKLLAPKPLYKQSFMDMRNIFINSGIRQRKHSINTHRKRSMDSSLNGKLEQSPNVVGPKDASSFQKMKEFIVVLLIAGSSVIRINLVTIFLLCYTFLLAHGSSASTTQKARKIYILGTIGVIIFIALICSQIYLTIAVFVQGVVDSPGILKDFVESMGVLASPTGSQNALDIVTCFFPDVIGLLGLIWLRSIYKNRVEEVQKEAIRPSSSIFCYIGLSGMLISGACHQSIAGAVLILLAFGAIFAWSLTYISIEKSRSYYVISIVSVILCIILVGISGAFKTPLVSDLLSSFKTLFSISGVQVFNLNIYLGIPAYFHYCSLILIVISGLFYIQLAEIHMEIFINRESSNNPLAYQRLLEPYEENKGISMEMSITV